MSDNKSVVRCECGFEVAARDEAALVSAIRRHAWEAHHAVYSVEEALAVILRADLDAGSAWPAPPSARAGHALVVLGSVD